MHGVIHLMLANEFWSMKKIALAAAALATLLSSAPSSQAAPVSLKDLKPESTGGRSDGAASRLLGFSPLLHEISLVDEESGKEVSNEPNGIYAREAESMGTLRFCEKSVGTFALYKWNLDGHERIFLIGTGHGFFERKDDGLNKVLCEDDFAKIHFDVQYKYSKNPNIDYRLGFKVMGKPLNYEHLLNYNFGNMPIYHRHSIYDIAIYEIEPNDPMLQSQTGGIREAIGIESSHHSQLRHLSMTYKTVKIARRTNYRDSTGNTKSVVVYEENCQINDALVAGTVDRLKKISCDTGGNSSGAPVTYGSFGSRKVLAMVFGESVPQTTFENFNNPKDVHGNYAIPAEAMIEAIERALQQH